MAVLWFRLRTWRRARLERACRKLDAIQFLDESTNGVGQRAMPWCDGGSVVFLDEQGNVVSAHPIAVSTAVVEG